MRSTRFIPLGALLLLAFIPLRSFAAELQVRPVEWAQPVLHFELNNFFQVSDELYRSRQPGKDAMRNLEKAGVRSIVNLREYHTDPEDVAESIRRYRVPMDAGEITHSDIEQALIAIVSAPKPALVHCWHGSDRTGAVVAAYRMVIQDWPREQAIAEFVHGGFGYHRTFYPNIETYLREVDIARLKQAVANAVKTR